MSGHEDKDQGPPRAEAEAETEVFTMDYGTGQEMTIPTADAVVDPPDGGKAWCLVFFAMILASFREAFIVLQQPTLFFMKSVTTTSTDNSSGGFGQSQGLFLPTLDSLSAEARTIVDTHKALFSISGILSGTLTVLIGYRWVALIGSVLTAVGYFGAAFSDISNVHLVSFLYGALPG
ncbi:uncharacterized protein [Haliotis asinina]|uniref:uncharacterized protein n=1 Tax=Haliotis asinina TaxID=109174 RepID=UPI003531F225